MTFLTNVGVKEILCSFTLFLEWKTDKEIPESNLEMFLPNNLALSGAKDNTTGPLNRGGSADLHLSSTLFGICQKSRKPSFLEVIDFYVLLVNGSLAALKKLLQQLLSHVNFSLDLEDLFCWYKQKR